MVKRKGRKKTVAHHKNSPMTNEALFQAKKRPVWCSEQRWRIELRRRIRDRGQLNGQYYPDDNEFRAIW